MGLTVNNFTFFAYLESEGGNDLEKNKFRAIKNRFSLFGYIIHNPQSKDGFGEYLQEEFESLSRLTGFNFLFTAFITEPINKKYGRERKGTEGLERGLDESLATDLPYFFAEFISERLKINSSSLPYIIVTDNPKNTSFYVIELTPDNLIQVMWDLTNVADNLDRLKKFLFNRKIEVGGKSPFNRISFENMIENLDHVIFKVDEDISLSNKLLECALILQDYSKHKLYGVQDLLPHGWVGNLKNKLGESEKEKLETAKILKEVSLQNEITRVQKEYYLMELMQITMDADFQIFKSCLEDDSYANLLDGALLMRHYDESLFTDASPFILPFLKAFEKEMNYSLVHWIRENLQIDLPEYFFRYQPEKLAILKKGGSSLDYNRLKTNSTFWDPPTMGGQVYGLGILSKERSLTPFKKLESTNSFLQIGEKIMGVRNPATHTVDKDASSLRLVIHKWRELWNDGYLWELSQLKFRYKN